MNSTPRERFDRGATRRIRARIERGGDRFWRLSDFPNLPATSVVQALSRLRREGTIERLSKGIYYRPRPTVVGRSRPNPNAIHNLLTLQATVFPAGVSAANVLGLTTQNPSRRELATTARSLPRGLAGKTAIIHTRRPAAWERLNETEGALLDVLRNGCQHCETSPKATIQRILTLLSEPGRFDRLLKAAYTEPPRVRAILGALGENLRINELALRKLRSSLNPISRFSFGIFSTLPTAKSWQSKE